MLVNLGLKINMNLSLVDIVRIPKYFFRNKMSFSEFVSFSRKRIFLLMCFSLAFSHLKELDKQLTFYFQHYDSIFESGLTLRNEGSFEQAIHVPDVGKNIDKLLPFAQQYLSVIEKYIKQYPSQWFMFRQFWLD